MNPEVFKRPCVLGTLQLVYSALAAAAATPANLQARADLYERLYRRAIRAARVQLDLDGDGRAETVRDLGAVAFVRQ